MIVQLTSPTMPKLHSEDRASRADVIRVAAQRYNLEPELVAAFILAEQRDQTQREDGKDYTAATSLLQGDTSIGLGQVKISTAQRNQIFTDLMSQRTQRNLKQNDVARLLADDAVNIFASARYIRLVADAGARTPAARLPKTMQQFRGLDMAVFARHSSEWTESNIRALASEYTSRAWDDQKLSPGWGYFVFTAYGDVRTSDVFRR